jgi:hypothetical protein
MQHQLLMLAAVMLGASLQLQAQRPPNVVLVMMVDIGYGDLGSYARAACGSERGPPNEASKPTATASRVVEYFGVSMPAR